MRQLLPLLALLSFLAFAAHAATYMNVTGTKQGVFKGDITIGPVKGAIAVRSLSLSLASTHDPVTGRPTGKRVHEPITLTKTVDASSIQFAEALENNEILKTVTFEFVSTSPATRQPITYYKVTLTNATVVSFKQTATPPTTPTTTEDRATEEITLTYEKMDLEYTEGGLVTHDNWSSSPM